MKERRRNSYRWSPRQKGGIMPLQRYNKRGIRIERGGTRATEQQVRDLQRDLRHLGYLKKGIDGKFGKATETAVKALQHDLLHNDGRSSRNDGNVSKLAVLKNWLDLTGDERIKKLAVFKDEIEHEECCGAAKPTWTLFTSETKRTMKGQETDEFNIWWGRLLALPEACEEPSGTR